VLPDLRNGCRYDWMLFQGHPLSDYLVRPVSISCQPFLQVNHLNLQILSRVNEVQEGREIVAEVRSLSDEARASVTPAPAKR
jgi:hypothetical protein